MFKKYLFSVASIALFVACNNAKKTESPSADLLKTASGYTEEIVDEISVKNIFKSYPRKETTAQEGEVILIPSYKFMATAVEKGEESQTFIYYHATMVKSGDQYSTVKFTFDGEQEVPNCMIIPIPAQQKVKKGDIILTWWQSGSGMKRAIVTNAENPSEPEVNYIDIDFENPATAKDGSTSIGQMKEKIKANTFVKLENDWDLGTTVAVKDGLSYKNWTLVNVTDNQVLCIGFAGKMKIFNKSDCTPLPIYTKVKAGDKVQAPWVGSYKNATVVKAIEELGRVVVQFDNNDKMYYIPYGDIATELIL